MFHPQVYNGWVAADRAHVCQGSGDLYSLLSGRDERSNNQWNASEHRRETGSHLRKSTGNIRLPQEVCHSFISSRFYLQKVSDLWEKLILKSMYRILLLTAISQKKIVSHSKICWKFIFPILDWICYSCEIFRNMKCWVRE